MSGRVRGRSTILVGNAALYWVRVELGLGLARDRGSEGGELALGLGFWNKVL